MKVPNAADIQHSASFFFFNIACRKAVDNPSYSGIIEELSAREEAHEQPLAGNICDSGASDLKLTEDTFQYTLSHI